MDKKYKHLIFEDRLDIQMGLKAGKKLYEISEMINKNPRTISLEIKRNLIKVENRRHKFNNYEKEYCSTHKSFPFVCDTCDKAKHCLADFYKYDAKKAQVNYEETLSSSRSGINLTPTQLRFVNDTLISGLKQGLSIEHIVRTLFTLYYRIIYLVSP